MNYVFSSLDDLEIESTIPICVSSMTKEVKKKKKKGKLIPVLGIVLVTTNMLSITCNPTWAVRPMPRSVPNLSWAFIDIIIPRQTSMANKTKINNALIKPNSSQTTENIKSL